MSSELSVLNINTISNHLHVSSKGYVDLGVIGGKLQARELTTCRKLMFYAVAFFKMVLSKITCGRVQWNPGSQVYDVLNGELMALKEKIDDCRLLKYRDDLDSFKEALDRKTGFWDGMTEAALTFEQRADLQGKANEIVVKINAAEAEAVDNLRRREAAMAEAQRRQEELRLQQEAMRLELQRQQAERAARIKAAKEAILESNRAYSVELDGLIAGADHVMPAAAIDRKFNVLEGQLKEVIPDTTARLLVLMQKAIDLRSEYSRQAGIVNSRANVFLKSLHERADQLLEEADVSQVAGVVNMICQLNASLKEELECEDIITGPQILGIIQYKEGGYQDDKLRAIDDLQDSPPIISRERCMLWRATLLIQEFSCEDVEGFSGAFHEILHLLREGNLQEGDMLQGVFSFRFGTIIKSFFDYEDAPLALLLPLLQETPPFLISNSVVIELLEKAYEKTGSVDDLVEVMGALSGGRTFVSKSSFNFFVKNVWERSNDVDLTLRLIRAIPLESVRSSYEAWIRLCEINEILEIDGVSWLPERLRALRTCFEGDMAMSDGFKEMLIRQYAEFGNIGGDGTPENPGKVQGTVLMNREELKDICDKIAEKLGVPPIEIKMTVDISGDEDAARALQAELDESAAPAFDAASLALARQLAEGIPQGD